MTANYFNVSNIRFTNAGSVTSPVWLIEQPHLWIGNPASCWWCGKCLDYACCRVDSASCDGRPVPDDRRRIRHALRAIVLDVRVG